MRHMVIALGLILMAHPALGGTAKYSSDQDEFVFGPEGGGQIFYVGNQIRFIAEPKGKLSSRLLPGPQGPLAEMPPDDFVFTIRLGTQSVVAQSRVYLMLEWTGRGMSSMAWEDLGTGHHLRGFGGKMVAMPAPPPAFRLVRVGNYLYSQYEDHAGTYVTVDYLDLDSLFGGVSEVPVTYRWGVSNSQAKAMEPITIDEVVLMGKSIPYVNVTAPLPLVSKGELFFLAGGLLLGAMLMVRRRAHFLLPAPIF